MDLKQFFDRAIELREEYAETSTQRLLILSQIVYQVFQSGGFKHSITIEGPITGRFANYDLNKVIDDLDINFRLVSYGEPTCTQRIGRACIARNDG